MSNELVNTSRSTIRKHEGAHRSAIFEGFDSTVDFGMSGGLLSYYQEKYGVEIDQPRPATLDYFVAAVGG